MRYPLCMAKCTLNCLKTEFRGAAMWAGSIGWSYFAKSSPRHRPSGCFSTICSPVILWPDLWLSYQHKQQYVHKQFGHKVEAWETKMTKKVWSKLATGLWNNRKKALKLEVLFFNLKLEQSAADWCVQQTGVCSRLGCPGPAQSNTGLAGWVRWSRSFLYSTRLVWGTEKPARSHQSGRDQTLLHTQHPPNTHTHTLACIVFNQTSDLHPRYALI